MIYGFYEYDYEKNKSKMIWKLKSFKKEIKKWISLKTEK